MKYEKADLWIGIVIVVIGAAALMGATAAAFAGTHGFGHFTDAAGLAQGLSAYAGRVTGVLFAVALLDASIIGAFAVSLSTAYAIGDVFGLKHSLHRGVRGAKGFYAIYAGLVGAAAAVVLIPGSPLGLLTEGVQVLAGVPLPSATASCCCCGRRRAGPWVDGAADQRVHLGGGGRAGDAVGRPHRVGAVPGDHRRPDRDHHDQLCRRVGAGRRGDPGPAAAAGLGVRLPVDRSARSGWRMPPLTLLYRRVMSAGWKLGMSALRLYLVVR